MKIKLAWLLTVSVLSFGLTGCQKLPVSDLPFATDKIQKLKYSYACGFCAGDNGAEILDVEIQRETQTIIAEPSVDYGSGEVMQCPALTITGGDYFEFLEALKTLKLKAWEETNSIVSDAPSQALQLASVDGEVIARNLGDSVGYREESFAGYESLLRILRRWQEGCRGHREPVEQSNIRALEYEVRMQGLAQVEHQFSARVEIVRHASEGFYRSKVRVKRGLAAEKSCAVRDSSLLENVELLAALRPVRLGTVDAILACGEPDVLTLHRAGRASVTAEVEMTSSVNQTVFKNTSQLRKIVDALIAECQ